jgi:ABC-type Fe3+/spermidine/putrescine transport system ATPase subunit
MNQGMIAQIGSAEELYVQPGSAFVAKFIGKINSIPARVERVGDGPASLNILLQTYHVPAPSFELKPGQTLSAFIRPESIQLSREVGKGQVKGRVLEQTFLGEKVDYLLDVQGHQMSATSYDPHRHGTFSPGQEVGVGFNESAIKVFPEEEK